MNDARRKVVAHPTITKAVVYLEHGETDVEEKQPRLCQKRLCKLVNERTGFPTYTELPKSLSLSGTDTMSTAVLGSLFHSTHTHSHSHTHALKS